MKDAQRANNVLVKLRQYLSSLPFMFQNASVITGQEEGLYGWITVNYLMGNLVEVWHSRHLSDRLPKRQDNCSFINLLLYVSSFINLRCFCRKTCGTHTYGRREQRLSAPWILEEHQHRLPLRSRMISRELTTCVSNCMVTLTMSTHTVSSAMAKMKLGSWFWRK